MNEAHAAFGMLLLGFVAAFIVVAAVLALTGGATAWFEWTWRAIVVLLGAQLALGVLLYVQGQRPEEPLHLVYGLVAIALFPFASTFASEAPRKARAGTLALAGLIVLLLVWRLLRTG